MPFVDYLKLSSSLQWQQRDVQNDVFVIEEGRLNLSTRFAGGTGTNQLNKSYLGSDNIPSGQTTQFDLMNLTRSLFGSDININFSGDNVKVIYVENLSTGTGQDLFVCATGTAGFTQLLGYSYLGTVIKPGSYRMFYDLIDGFPIFTGERYLYLSDINGNSGGIDYELGIFGVDFE